MSEFHLNEQQKKAVEHRDGPLMILAGAGSGKTRVITLRVLHLIKSGVAPEKILAITFTNKAAKEMKERITNLIHNDSTLNFPVSTFSSHTIMPHVSTFHSLGVYILRQHADILGLKRHFSIFDRADSTRAIKTALKRLSLDPKQFEPRTVLSVISRNKSEGTSAHTLQTNIENIFEHTVGRV